MNIIQFFQGDEEILMIHILVDAHSFDGDGQGIVSYIQGIYSEILKDKTFDITFASSNIEKLKRNFGDHIKVLKIPCSFFLYRLFVFFPKILKSGTFDYVHFQYMLPFFLSKKTKVITTIHDIIPVDFPEYYSLFYRLKVRLFFYRAAKKSDVLLTVSGYSKNRIASKFKIPSDKIYITPNAVKNVFNEEKNAIQETTEDNNNYFLYVSRIEERKNHITLLKAFVDGHFYKYYSLIFVGSQSSRSLELYEYFDSLSFEIKEKVRFFSGLSDSELNDIYKNATLFIYPSIAEGFGIPPLEAATHLKKVVCSNSTAMSDFNFFKKYSFNPFDENELIERIKIILKDGFYPAEQIKDQILEKYSWKKSADVLKKILVAMEEK